jgi:hypothetical protein
VRVFVGGAPVTAQYADTIGADGYSESAPGAVALARKAVAGGVFSAPAQHELLGSDRHAL